MSDQRTEKATPQRQKKARESGDSVRSRDLLAGAATLAGMLALGAVARSFVSSWRQCFSQSLEMVRGGSGDSIDARQSVDLVRSTLAPAAWPLVTVMLAAFFAALAVGMAQSGGLQFYPKLVQPKLSRISLGSHAKTLFSMRSPVRLVKALVPATAVVLMGWQVLRHTLEEVPVLGIERLPRTLLSIYGLGLRAAMVMVAWAAIDYAVEWRARAQRTRMTKQEMREEIKESIGNPQIKGKIRQMQRAMRRRKVKADLSRASVVITNPTHYAVALEFSFETMQAPTVLAKGRDLLALEIREEARWAGVPLIENAPLARSLYRSVEPGQAVPYELYSAIAGILAFLMREKQEQQMREARASARPSARTATVTGMHGFQGGM